MTRVRTHHRFLLAVLLAVAAACSTKSPTEPVSAPVNPKVPPPVASFAVTVTANPNHLTIGSSKGSTITVRVVNAQDGTPPADTTPVTLTSTLGEFNATGSGLLSVALQLVHGQAQAILFPATSVGTAAVTATVFAGTSSAASGATTVTIGAAGTFFLNSISPNTGDPAGGLVVTISGGGFAAPVSVTFGSSSAPVKSVSPNAIQVIVPPSSQPVPVGTTLQVSVTVNNNLGGTSPGSATLTNAFTYVPGGGGGQQPQVFSVSPASGTNDGGTQIVIVGQGFVPPVQVFFGTGSTASSFNGVEATVQSATATQLVVISPPARGFGQDNTNVLVSILVKNVSSGFSTIDAAAFKYGSRVIVTSAGPTQTLWNQPVKVTIFGQGFADPVAVGLAGVAAQVLSTSGTEIQVLSPVPNLNGCSNISGPVHVTNINNGDSGDGPPFTFVVPHPSISGVTPNSGTGNGGDQVVVSGEFFEPSFGDRVLFGGTAGSVNAGASSSTQLVVTTPPFTGTFPTQACVSGGSSGTMNIPTAVDVQVTNVASGCSDILPKGFTYIPADQSCHVTPPPPPPAPKASFTSATSTGSFVVIFNDTSSGPPTSWSWNFGDPASGAANTSAQQNPVHDFLPHAPATYVVTLTVTNATGSSTVSNFVTVPGS